MLREFIFHCRYGLIMPKKSNQVSLQPRLSAFDDNSDSGDEGGGDWVKKALKVCIRIELKNF